MNYGLLGRKLSHSYSPLIHNYFGNQSYDLFEVEPDSLGDFLRSNPFQGINVTIPYKKDVIPYCHELSPIAKRLGAVNTIVRTQNRTLYGHNTDYFGFQYMLNKSGLSVADKKVLVLGSGGASVTVKAVLEDHGANVTVISRSGQNNYGNINIHADASVIVNTTPVGMYPHNGTSPIDISIFPALDGILDLIYNPARTKLIMDAEARGLIAMSGLWMLVAQAYEAARLFAVSEISPNQITQIHNQIYKQMQNRILIGMPGSGKSTLGRLLANATGREFVDADMKIEEYANMPIPEIFEKYGEAYFRKIETEVLTNLCKESGLVIATGGGCVTRTDNYPLLHQNGIIYWIQRDVNSLPTDGRPLSQNNSLHRMFQERKPLYEKFSDFTIENNGQISQTLQHILALEDNI